MLVPQTVKEVNQSLVDDNLVETDKIGSGAFFWSLPSQVQNVVSNQQINTLKIFSSNAVHIGLFFLEHVEKAIAYFA